MTKLEANLARSEVGRVVMVDFLKKLWAFSHHSPGLADNLWLSSHELCFVPRSMIKDDRYAR